ncbi:MAG TPA: Dabb family protein [Clostridia bacterium]|nr:Dabb family protein [Clostridia bacterium]
MIKWLIQLLHVLHSERSYDLALITKFDSLDDFKAYKENPIHVEVSKYIHSVWKESASVDYETLD